MRRFVGIAFITAIVFSFGFQRASAQEIASRHVLNNGLVVLIKESHKAPLVALEAQIKAGSATEQDYLGSGISHFVEHMLFKGTKKRPKAGDIEREIKSLGGYVNAFTSHDSTGVQIIIPSAHLNKGLEILKDILTEPLFDQQELEKERSVILKEIKLNLDDPGRYLSLLLWSNMFKTHNYRFPVIGHENLLKKLKREDLIKFHKAYYIPDNIVLGVAGDAAARDALEKIDRTFGNIERVYPAQSYSKEEPPQIAEIDVEEEKDLGIAYMSLGFHSVGVRDTDLFSLDVLAMILGSGEDSRLFKSLYREKKLVYSIGSFNYTPKDPGVFVISAALKKEDVDKAIGEIWSQIESLKTQPVADRELDKARNNVLSAYIFSRQTVQAEAGDLATGEVFAGDYDFSKKYVEGVKTVTKESIMEAARKYLRKENSTLIKLVPEEIKGRKEAQITVKPFQYDIEKFELKNNLKVLLYEDHTLPITSLIAIGLGGLRTEGFKDNGISNLVATTLSCGTKNKSEEEIFSQIEGMGARLNSFSSSNTFGLSASSLSKDFNPVSETFADVLENPQFSADKIEREKAAIQGGIKSIGDDIYQTGMRTLKYTLFRRHPYRFQAAGRLATIKNLSQKEAFDYYRAYYRPDNMVLVVSGDINKNEIKERLATLFEKFEKGAAVSIAPPKEKKRSRPRIITRNIEKEQSLILLGYLGTTMDSHDKYALDALSSVLSGINGRLSQNIREAKGLAYTLDVTSAPGLERGMIIFYIGTTKGNLETAKNELFKEIQILKKDGVKNEELAAAKNELIGLHKMGLQRIQDVSMRIALDELYGLGCNNFLMYEDRIKHITKECVLRAAKKYLGSNGYVLLILRGAG